MESKQLNVRVPLFVHDELAALRLSLREIGRERGGGGRSRFLKKAAEHGGKNSAVPVVVHLDQRVEPRDGLEVAPRSAWPDG